MTPYIFIACVTAGLTFVVTWILLVQALTYKYESYFKRSIPLTIYLPIVTYSFAILATILVWIISLIFSN